MPLPLPNLDDRTYKDLLNEAQTMIPTLAPEWTNHNPSDPGITIIEVFAYLTEMMLFRLNRITEAQIRVFLKLLNGPDWELLPGRNIDEEVRDTILALRQTNRAVTAQDFEALALAADPTVARARCVIQRNLASENLLLKSVKKPGHISVVIVPESKESNPQPDAELRQRVADYLEPRRLLTTQVHIVGPRYFTLGVHLTLVLKPDTLEDKFLFGVAFKQNWVPADLQNEFANKGIVLSNTVKVAILEPDSKWLLTDEEHRQIYIVRKEQNNLNVYQDIIRPQMIQTLQQYLHPLTGGPDGEGWPFGRNVYVSELYELFDTQPEIDYVEPTADDLIVDESEKERLDISDGKLVAVKIQPDELVDIPLEKIDIKICTQRRF